MLVNNIVQYVNDKQYFPKDGKTMQQREMDIFKALVYGLVKDYAEVTFEDKHYQVDLTLTDLPYSIQKLLFIRWNDVSKETELSDDDLNNPMLIEAYLSEYKKQLNKHIYQACEEYASERLSSWIDEQDLRVCYHADNGEIYYLRK